MPLDHAAAGKPGGIAMAGDWIAMQTSLWDCPEVVRILSAFCPQNVRIERDSMSAPCPQHVHTGAERNKMKCQIIGALFRTWTLFDMYSDDGELFGYDSATLNDYVGIDSWAENLQHVGWLTLSPQSITMNGFEKWMSKSAKRRLQDADRKRRQRIAPPESTSRSCPQSVRKMSASSVTREEKRREEKISNTNTPLPPNVDNGGSKPANHNAGGGVRGLNRPGLKDLIFPTELAPLTADVDRWVEYLWSRDGKLNPITINAHLLSMAQHGTEKSREAITIAIERGYAAPAWGNGTQASDAAPKKFQPIRRRGAEVSNDTNRI